MPGSSLAESRVHARPPGHAPAEHALSGHLGSASIPEPGLSYVLGVEEKRQAPCWLMAWSRTATKCPGGRHQRASCGPGSSGLGSRRPSPCH